MTPLLVVFTALALAGCDSAPEPVPTPTSAFATEEEAFAAAEEVYREYNEAGNARIAGEFSPDPQDYLIGLALEGDIDGIRYLEEQGLALSGTGGIASFTGLTSESVGGYTTAEALVCLDVAEIRLLDSTGTDVTAADRPDIVPQIVEFIEVDGQLRISAESSGEPSQC